MTNVHGNTNDPNRGNWCTPKWLADLIGFVDLDPCSNERSHIRSIFHYDGSPGLDGLTSGLLVAGLDDPSTLRTFINPPYAGGSVIKWVNAYKHTDFIFLLRFDPSTKWFAELIKHTKYIWFPLGRRINFEPPPGVQASSSTMPHALFCKSEPNAALKAEGISFNV